MYKITIKDSYGSYVAETSANYRLAELYRETCHNVLIEDVEASNSAIMANMPGDAELKRELFANGRTRESVEFSAKVICACIVLIPVLIIAEILINQ